MDPNRGESSSRRRRNPYEARQPHPSTSRTQQAGDEGHSVPDYSAQQDAALFAQLAAGTSISPSAPIPHRPSDFSFDPFNPSLGGTDHPFSQDPYGHIPQGAMPPQTLSTLDLGYPWNDPNFRMPTGGGAGMNPSLLGGGPVGGNLGQPVPGSSGQGYPTPPPAPMLVPPGGPSPPLSYDPRLSSPGPPITRSTSAATTSNTGNEESETTSPDTERHVSLAEEKRKRNTAASARFRVKKKQKIATLERTVADLTARGEQLEKEVQDLRRENGWLKELVLMKGTKETALDAVSQLAQLNQGQGIAVQGSSSQGGGALGAGSSAPPTTRRTTRRPEGEKEQEEGSSDELDSDADSEFEEEKPKGKRGKGKSTKK